MATATVLQAPAAAVEAAQEYVGNLLYRSLRDDDRPQRVVAAEGMFYTLDDGRKILDCCGGAAVTCLGHSHPKVIKAIKDQLDSCSYAYNQPFTTAPAEELATLLCERSDGAFNRVGYVSGGSEAVETMLKLARQYWLERGQPQRTNFIGRKMSYHGNTLGCLGASNHPGRRTMYEPILALPAFHHVEPAFAYRYKPPSMSDDEYVEYLRKDLEAEFEKLGPETVIGFICETVVGATTGAVAPPKGYLSMVRSICDKHGVLLLLDEVMSGMGRCGATHAWQALARDRDGDRSFRPDLQTVAKGLGGGFQPVGAVLISKRVTEAMGGSKTWHNGFTYGCHPTACAAALAVQRVVEEEDLLENVKRQGQYLGNELRRRIEEDEALANHVGDIRGEGLLWAVEYVKDKKRSGDEPFDSGMKPRFAWRVSKTALVQECLQMLSFSGGVDGVKGDYSLIAPAYNATSEDIDDIVGRFTRALKATLLSL